MSIIHKTTLTPTKLELLTAWLPAQPWYAATGRAPELSKTGGFRLDDPKGDVGIEFMVVQDASGDRPAWYHVPMTYRAAPLDGADRALIGTTEHGVLGRRWVYDGPHDPVFVTQLLALLQGRAEPQAQSVSHTPDPSVTAELTGAGSDGLAGAGPDVPAEAGSDVPAGAAETPAVADGPDATRLVVAGGGPALEVTRVLRPESGAETTEAVRGHVTAGWQLPDGGEARGRFVVLRDAVS